MSGRPARGRGRGRGRPRGRVQLLRPSRPRADKVAFEVTNLREPLDTATGWGILGATEAMAGSDPDEIERLLPEIIADLRSKVAQIARGELTVEQWNEENERSLDEALAERLLALGVNPDDLDAAPATPRPASPRIQDNDDELYGGSCGESAEETALQKMAQLLARRVLLIPGYYKRLLSETTARCDACGKRTEFIFGSDGFATGHVEADAAVAATRRSVAVLCFCTTSPDRLCAACDRERHWLTRCPERYTLLRSDGCDLPILHELKPNIFIAEDAAVTTGAGITQGQLQHVGACGVEGSVRGVHAL
jgi:hypothetical protein